MDRIREKKNSNLKKWLWPALVMVLVLFVSYKLLIGGGKSKYGVDKARITTAKVIYGEFTESIPQSGIIQPETTRYIDAIEGGVIQEIFLEPGARVNPGDVILTISNSNLQLDVLNREAQLYEQINLLRNTRLSIEQNILNLQTQLAEIDYRLGILEPEMRRTQELYDEKVISQKEYEAIREEYEYNIKRRAYTYRSYKKDSSSFAYQLTQLNESEKRMLQSLFSVSKIMDNLIIKAPITGILSTPDLEIGQSVSVGQRLGQIDGESGFKLRSAIDEIYLPQIDTGLLAYYTYNNTRYELKIDKIFPTVAGGQFEVDMEFLNGYPQDIKRGQSVRLTLELGNPRESLLVPIGGFYQSTAGRWAFVREPGDNFAARKDIKLGRKNLNYYEVIEGLNEGDEVITSSYERYIEKDIIIINE